MSLNRCMTNDFIFSLKISRKFCCFRSYILEYRFEYYTKNVITYLFKTIRIRYNCNGNDFPKLHLKQGTKFVFTHFNWIELSDRVSASCLPIANQMLNKYSFRPKKWLLNWLKKHEIACFPWLSYSYHFIWVSSIYVDICIIRW